ncbi:probable sugar phosphate/phosphate translocator At4g32390 [Oryza glaberrima]|uniref:probable sugar phosphate/phosphate translocator At4g32390 n=1 Tax=Oryza glaberrima TaxID=4538 RepID=UPI00224C5DA2|nr:probable sugar phosphate/phosphate translocator At4g32390 [Oryza glaberrima]
MDVVSSLSSSPAPAPSVLKSLLLSYAYVSVWITFSFSVIMYNKYILDPTMYNWPFPISITMVHMVFCASLTVVLIRVLRVVAEPTSPPMTPSLYAASVVPIGVLYALSLWFSNSAYIYLSVSFIQMLKALMPVAVYCLAVAFRTDSFHHASMLNMLGISAGIAVAAYGEARFDAFGVMLQLVAVTAEATRLVLIQILLTGATPPPAPAPAQADRNVEMGLLDGESSASRPAMKPRQVLDCEIAPPSNRATEFGSTGLRVGIDWDAGAIWAF